jgi:hypothetical protein
MQSVTSATAVATTALANDITLFAVRLARTEPRSSTGCEVMRSSGLA